MSQRRTDSRVIGMLAFAIIALLVVMVGCERKITGNVDVDETVSDQCFTCHDGVIDAMQGEWANSIHASGENVDYTSRVGRDCSRCHNQDGFIDYVAGSWDEANDYGNAKAIGCFACHKPHETADFAVLDSAQVTMLSGAVFNYGRGNLCANCHQATRIVRSTDTQVIVTSSHWGPHHGPQGDLLIGTGGYEGFPGFTNDVSIAHRDLANACVYCHMSTSQTHAGYNVGGHSFNMEDEAGNNLTLVCRDCHPDIGSRGGDYEDILAADDFDEDGSIEGLTLEIEGMMDSLGALLELQGIFDSEHHLAGPFPDTVVDVHLGGAMFNFLMIEEDRSHGIHNPKYVVNLLAESIAYVSGL